MSHAAVHVPLEEPAGSFHRARALIATLPSAETCEGQPPCFQGLRGCWDCHMQTLQGPRASGHSSETRSCCVLTSIRHVPPIPGSGKIARPVSAARPEELAFRGLSTGIIDGFPTQSGFLVLLEGSPGQRRPRVAAWLRHRGVLESALLLGLSFSRCILPRMHPQGKAFQI